MNIQEDLGYWGFTDVLMDACCGLKHYPELEISQNETKQDQKNKRRELQMAHEENFGSSMIGRCRTFLWSLTEHPESSTAARVRSCILKFHTNEF